MRNIIFMEENIMHDNLWHPHTVAKEWSYMFVLAEGLFNALDETFVVFETWLIFSSIIDESFSKDHSAETCWLNWGNQQLISTKARKKIWAKM